LALLDNPPARPECHVFVGSTTKSTACHHPVATSARIHNSMTTHAWDLPRVLALP
jgi:hypothetical protein